MARHLYNLEGHLPYKASIKHFLNGANRSKITRVCKEMRPKRKPNVYHQSGGDSPIPTVVMAVRLGYALPSPFLKFAKRSIDTIVLQKPPLFT